MHTPRQNILHNPFPTSLFGSALSIKSALSKEKSTSNLDIQVLHKDHEITKDVGMGLLMTFCLGVCILFPFDIPPSSFYRNDISICSTHFGSG